MKLVLLSMLFGPVAMVAQESKPAPSVGSVAELKSQLAQKDVQIASLQVQIAQMRIDLLLAESRAVMASEQNHDELLRAQVQLAEEKKGLQGTNPDPTSSKK